MTLVIREILAFRGLDARQLVERHALLLGKAQRGRRRLTVAAEGGRHRRAGDRLVQILLALGDPRDAGGQPAWRAEGFDRRARRDTQLLEPRFQPIGQLRVTPRHPRRGQLFDADLDQ